MAFGNDVRLHPTATDEFMEILAWIDRLIQAGVDRRGVLNTGGCQARQLLFDRLVLLMRGELRHGHKKEKQECTQQRE